MIAIRSVLILVTLIFIVNDSVRPPRIEYREIKDSACKQSAAEQTSLMMTAEKQKFTLRRIEFLGLTHTSDQLVRDRMGPSVNEGDLFSRKKLVKGLQNMSKLTRAIYPVRMRDVVFSLNKPEQVVDMTICFKERGR